MPFKSLFYFSSSFSRLAFSVLFFVTAKTVVSGATKHSDYLTAMDIIRRMQEAYANSRFYSDSGVFKTVFINPDRKRTVEKPFTTAFIRSDRFRFEYRGKKPIFGERGFIIFRKGNDLQTYSDLKLRMQLESLDKAVAAATGISG